MPIPYTITVQDYYRMPLPYSSYRVRLQYAITVCQNSKLLVPYAITILQIPCICCYCIRHLYAITTCLYSKSLQCLPFLYAITLRKLLPYAITVCFHYRMSLPYLSKHTPLPNAATVSHYHMPKHYAIKVCLYSMPKQYASS